MKKTVSFALAVLFALSFVNFAFAYENLVDDSAMLFSLDETNEITMQADSYSSSTGYSLAVVTTDDALGKSAMEYADDYHDDLIDNQGWSEDSMLFLIDMDNREIYISATGAAINSYDSSRVENIIDGGYSELVQGNYAQAIILMTETAESIYNEASEENYDDIYGFIGSYEDYGYSDYDYDDYNNSYSSGFSVDFTDILVYIIVGIGVAAITVLIIKSKYKNHGKDDLYDTDDISLDITGSNDSVISRNVVTTKIPKNNNHGKHGGGFSGGGSVHRSSGGRMHGGGGRKF